MPSTSLLSIDGLNVHTHAGHHLLKDVSFTIRPGQQLGLIGESGSGKSLTALAVMGLLSETLHTRGHISLQGAPGNLLRYRPAQLAQIRGRRVSMVFQEPMTALNPLMKVGRQVAEAVQLHRRDLSRHEARRAVIELFDDVRLPHSTAIYERYPHQLSGGQRQRVLIAMAMANDPELIICDEPTTALDATVQRSILRTLSRLAAERGTAMLMITHDLGVISQTCTDVLVMRGGVIVERGSVSQVLASPQHPYTTGLLAASDLSARDARGHLYTARSAQQGYVPGVALASPRLPEPGEEILRAEEISKTYRGKNRLWRRHTAGTQALAPMSLSVHESQRLGIVGESGSGKSTLLSIIAGLSTPTTGRLTLDGHPARAADLQHVAHMVFQDPASSLNPRMRIGHAVAEPLLATGMSAAERAQRVGEVLEEVGLSASMATRYPHEFSGGQRQRISLARALAPRPRILLADEPVSALDVSARAHVLNTLLDVVRDYRLALVFISHDLGVIRTLCSDVIVLKDGLVVERGDVNTLFATPREDYTKKLISAVPRVAVRGDEDPPGS